MTVNELIKRLELVPDKEKVVILTDGKGWCNIKKIREDISTVEIYEDDTLLFD